MKKPKKELPLHQFVATGGKPDSFKATKGTMPPKKAPKK